MSRPEIWELAEEAGKMLSQVQSKGEAWVKRGIITEAERVQMLERRRHLVIVVKHLEDAFTQPNKNRRRVATIQLVEACTPLPPVGQLELLSESIEGRRVEYV